MPIDIYSTQTLVGVVRALPRPQPFLYNTFFPNLILSEDEEIVFDVEIAKRRIAPFVAPHVAGRVVAQNGYRTDRFAPAYVKDKRAISPNKVLRRRPGEPISGALSPAEREAAILADTLQDQIDMLTRRMEVMAADALLDGAVLVEGDGYAATSVDFGRPAGNTIALTGGARWGETGVSPVADIQTWCETVLQAGGYPVTDIVLVRSAWALLQKDPEFKNVIDTTLRGTTGEGNLGATVQEGAQLVGMLNSTVRLWLYANWYVNDAGSEVAILPANTVILSSTVPDAVGDRAFGSVRDPEFNYQALEFAPKSWVEKDPAGRWMLLQSAPLVIPRRPASTLTATVR